MPTCVVGMHRSGTSMITGVLARCGLRLGAAEDLIQATPANPEGYFEHRGVVEINDRLLAHLGGSWDAPPDLPDDWESDPALQWLQDRAHAIAGSLGPEPYGFKDPRASLTLPFWQQVCPGLRTVLCLRHPLDVGRSLARRDGLSTELALQLWECYTRTVLDDVPNGKLLVTSYESWFDDFDEQLDRILEFFEGELHAPDRSAIAAHVQPLFRHNRRNSSGAHMRDTLTQCYAETLALAGSAGVPRQGSRQRQLQRQLDALWPALSARDEVSRDIQTNLALMHDRITDLHRILQVLLERSDALVPGQVEEALDAAALFLTTQEDVDARGEAAYQFELSRLRAAVRRHVPAAAVVAVVSRGEDALVDLPGCLGWHFPADPQGGYVGYYPADDEAAIKHLEELRGRGMDFLVMPETSKWWLDAYPGLAAHLDRYPAARVFNGLLWDVRADACDGLRELSVETTDNG